MAQGLALSRMCQVKGLTRRQHPGWAVLPGLAHQDPVGLERLRTGHGKGAAPGPAGDGALQWERGAGSSTQ